MRCRRVIGTLAVAAGLFLALTGSASAGADMGPSAGPVGQMPAGKDGGPMPAGMGPTAGGPAGPAGAGPARVGAAPAQAGGLDPAAASAALSGLGLLVLGGGVALRRRSA